MVKQKNQPGQVILVDDQDRVIGHKPRRERTHADIYRVSSLWLTNSRGQVLLAQRSFNSNKNPGCWGPAVSGTVEVGETYSGNMYKEAEEEIGLTGVKFQKGPKQFMDNGRYRYFVQWYTGEVDRAAADFRLQPEEVEAVRWAEPAELLEDVAAHPDRYTPSAKTWHQLFL